MLGVNLPRSTFLAALWISARATTVMLVVGGIVYGVLFAIERRIPTRPRGDGVRALHRRRLAPGMELPRLSAQPARSGRHRPPASALRHFDEFTVFGVLWAALLIVPGMFIVILPMGVAGATRLVVEAEVADEYEAAA